MNTLLPSITPAISVGLSQPQGYRVPQEFTDSDGITWKLAKAYNDASHDLPDVKRVHATAAWNHSFLGSLQTPLYVYVLEGILQPRTNLEQPCRVLLSWFSTKNVPEWTPQMITEQEWLKANMYVAEAKDSRLSKLQALCNVTEPVKEETKETELLDIPELNMEKKSKKA